MNPVVKQLILKRFRSIPSEVEFDNPTFLVGQNGAGKSNFVQAFSFLADAMASPLQAVFDKQGGIAGVRNRSVRTKPPTQHWPGGPFLVRSTARLSVLATPSRSVPCKLWL